MNLSDRNSNFDPYAAAGLSYAQLEAQVTRNIATMPFGRIGNGDRGLIFPVSVPAPISSFFGFRIHPIAQTQRLHTGTDIAAPYGTPVLAAFSGKVVESSDLGGYGLTVVLSHNEGTSETLYAHMSELLVNVGDEVKQGDPIGRVGSTGFSTGPHLHFEVKQMTDMGWVYLDANRQLEVALERLIDSSQLAQLPRRDRGSL
jgi:murein DD-endopeptidase MepM/ murein hydrolase activator NlpD